MDFSLINMLYIWMPTQLFCKNIVFWSSKPFSTLTLPTPPSLTLLHPTLPYSTLPYPTLLNPTLIHPTLPYSTLPYTTLLHPTLPYSTLPYPTLLYPNYSYGPLMLACCYQTLLCIRSNRSNIRYLCVCIPFNTSYPILWPIQPFPTHPLSYFITSTYPTYLLS